MGSKSCKANVSPNPRAKVVPSYTTGLLAKDIGWNRCAYELGKVYVFKILSG